MVGSYIFVLFILIEFNIVLQQDTRPDIVVTLTKDNFTTAIAENEYVFVHFYAPWCVHCKILAPRFEEAASKMLEMNSSIKFAKVDATENDELAYRQKVLSYPTLKFYRNGLSVQYSGENFVDSIIKWLKDELEPPVTQLKTSEEIQQFLKEKPLAIIGFFNDNNAERSCLFNGIAAEMKDLFVFGMASKDKGAELFNLTAESIVLFKPYDERMMVYNGRYDREAIKRFIQLHSLPLIIEFDFSTASQILHGPTRAFLLFYISDEGDQLEEYVYPLRNLARSYRDYVLFVTVTYDDADKRRVFEYFGITKKETPTILLIKMNENDELIKYKPYNKEITVKSVDDFIQQYIADCLEPYYLSQTLPDDWDKHPVKTLVATNFHDAAFDSLKTVLVEFYAPWCGLCKQLEPILEQLAEKYRNNDEVIIAKINGVSNEIENLKVTAFPTIKLFLQGSNKMISYNGARTLEGLEEFLASNGVHHKERDEL